MSELTFQQFNILCKLNTDKKYVDECINVFENEDCIFYSGISMPKNEILSLYQLRLDIAKECGNFTDAYLKNFKDCVTNLEKSKSESLSTTTFYSNQNSFIIFFELLSQIILGILKSDNLGINAIEKQETETISKGYTSTAEKYFKGVLIRDWK